MRVVAVAPAAAGSSGSSVRLSPAVGGLLAVQRAESGRSPTGLVQARLALANCGLQSLVVRLRTQFLDAQGWPSEPVSAWREVIVAPRTEFAIDERSTQPGSVAFRVELDRAEVASRP